MRFERPPEPYAPLEPVATCDPTPKPGVEAFRDFTLSNFGGLSGGITRDCSIGASSKHHEGRAWDWFPPQPPIADRWIEELLAEHDGEDAELARRAGLRTIIWNHRIWIAGTGWHPYIKSSHTDHVHFGFGWDGAMGRTSFYEQQGGGLRVVPFLAGLNYGRAGDLDGQPDMSEHDDDMPSEPGGHL